MENYNDWGKKQLITRIEHLQEIINKQELFAELGRWCYKNDAYLSSSSSLPESSFENWCKLLHYIRLQESEA